MGVYRGDAPQGLISNPDHACAKGQIARRVCPCLIEKQEVFWSNEHLHFAHWILNVLPTCNNCEAMLMDCRQLVWVHLKRRKTLKMKMTDGRKKDRSALCKTQNNHQNQNWWDGDTTWFQAKTPTAYDNSKQTVHYHSVDFHNLFHDFYSFKNMSYSGLSPSNILQPKNNKYLKHCFNTFPINITKMIDSYLWVRALTHLLAFSGDTLKGNSQGFYHINLEVCLVAFNISIF